MGNVRSQKIKRIARELFSKYPDRLTADCDENKQVLASLIITPSKRFRNTIAGYITRIVVLSQTKESEIHETDE